MKIPLGERSCQNIHLSFPDVIMTLSLTSKWILTPCVAMQHILSEKEHLNMKIYISETTRVRIRSANLLQFKKDDPEAQAEHVHSCFLNRINPEHH